MSNVTPIGFEMMEEGINVHPPPAGNHDTAPLVEPNNVPIGFEDQANPAFVADEANRNRTTDKGKVHKVSFNVDPEEGEVTSGPKTRVAKDGTEPVLPYMDGVGSCEELTLLTDFERQQEQEQAEYDAAYKAELKELETLYFRDGKRRIDFVLTYRDDEKDKDRDKKIARRKLFEENLMKDGMEIEYEERARKKADKVRFVKLHCPWDVLTTYAEIMSMKMPLAENDLESDVTSCWSKCPTPFDVDEDYLPPVPDYFTAAFSRSRADQFVIEDQETFFSSAQRSLIAYELLSRCIFETTTSEKKKKRFGIKNLVNAGVYTGAFPLHEGEFASPHSLLTKGKANDRHLLYETWARPGRFYKFQPLDHIRKYFGEKIGIYFAWLGYYTGLLIPAAMVGLAVFLYGCIQLFQDRVQQEICDENIMGNTTMCPLCDERCTYWKLKKSCLYTRATYLFDNEATVFFAAFMALWATFFHEMWKRKQAEIEYDWDVADFEEEENIRPEFEAQVATTKKNPINQVTDSDSGTFYRDRAKLLLLELDEPHVRFLSKLARFASSFTVVIFMLLLVVAAAFGVILYRVTVAAIFYSVKQEDISARANLLTTVTAAIINLIIIVILSMVYLRIAEFLTNFEMHRTETEWEDSFTFKMFLFQFINHYSSLFYIAFFKGRFLGRPGEYNRELNGKRQEECDPAGCLIELCIQLAIVMVGKQTLNNFKEIILPKIMNLYKTWGIPKEQKQKLPRWEDDYNLADMNKLGLFDEYLEMVIQFGFVTIFVAAFPLAPLFALINNVIEIRLDAYKFVTQWRRPLAVRGQDIGIWFGILRGISTIAVITNSVIIAFTTEFIPKLVYVYGYSNNELDGYVNFSLSTFKVKDFEPESRPANNNSEVFGVVTECRYRDFRNQDDYTFNMKFWHVLAARLAFTLIFILLVFFFSWLVSYIVPDIPKSVKLQVLREKYLAKEAIMEAESLRRRKDDKKGPAANTESSVNY